MSDAKFDKLRQGGWSYRKFTTAAAKPKLWTGHITENGTHYPPEGYDAYNAVVVEVPASGDAKGLIEGGVETVVIPEDVTKIGDGKFYGDKILQDVQFPYSMEEIGSYAFYECSQLYLTSGLPEVTTIGAHAFEKCTSLELFTLPYYLTSIGESAFNGCSSFTGLSIYGEKCSIGKMAFANCENLQSVEMGFDNTMFVDIDPTAFENCPSLMEIFVSWSEGEVSGAPWGATNATIYYNHMAE